MFNIFRRNILASSQKSSQPILDNGIDMMVSQRDIHLAEMNRLENIINAAQIAYNQHCKLYEALNNTLFTINHPFDTAALERVVSDAVDADLSVDQPNDEERDTLTEDNIRRHGYSAPVRLAPAPTADTIVTSPWPSLETGEPWHTDDPTLSQVPTREEMDDLRLSQAHPIPIEQSEPASVDELPRWPVRSKKARRTETQPEAAE